MMEPETGTIQPLIYMGAAELARRIKLGEVSSREAVEAHIRRIEAVNPRLNAVVIPLFDDALARAAEADARRARGEELGPLHGVPITIKEQFLVAGTQTTLGLPHHVGNKASGEGTLVLRLRRAGAIILGKTNIAQTLIFHESDNPVYGRTNNPWNLERTPGGSSGGEAAIIAAGGSSLGLGGDLGGSLRIPAHFCGIHTLKPTSRRLTNDDNPPYLLAVGQETIVAQQGPMARTVADLRLAMGILAAPSAEKTGDLVPPMLWPDPNAVSVAGLRVGMYADDGYFKAAPALRRAVREAAEILRERGTQVEEFTPPAVAEAVHLFLAVLSADGTEWLKRLLGGDKPDFRIKGLLQGGSVPNALRPIVAKLMEMGGQRRLAFALRSMGRSSAGTYWHLVQALNAYRSRFLAAMDAGGFDALICPPHALPALTHGGSDQLTVFSAASYAVLYNVVGMPAGVVAATTVHGDEESDRPDSKDPTDRAAAQVERGSVGLPVGVQVIARHWQEDIVLATMAALEEGFRAKPEYPCYSVLLAD